MSNVHSRTGSVILYLIIYGSLFYSLYFFITEPSWLILLSIILLKVYQTLGGGFAHLSITHLIGKPNSIKDKVGAFFWLLCGQGRLSHFAYYHSLHHRFPDTTTDPHSPKHGKKWWCWWLTAYKYNLYLAFVRQHTDKIDTRIVKDAFVHYTDKCYWECLGVIGIVCLLAPTWFSVYIIMLPFALNFLDGTYFFVKYFHRSGKAKNYKWVNYWIAGKSGLHGAHHRIFK
jgi:fatty-acid desaturase